MSNHVLVLVEHKDGKVKKTSFELLSEGRVLAQSLGGELHALLIGEQPAGLVDSIQEYGVATAHIAANASLKTYSAQPYAHLVAKVAKEGMGAVLATASAFGRDLLPRVAAKLSAGIASDCTAIEIEQGKVVATRPIYSGKASVKVRFENSPIALISCRPNVFETQKQPSKAPAIVSVATDDLPSAQATIREIVAAKSDKADLTEASIVVSAGRSIKSAENFAMIQSLADILGAAVGASRAAVDAGYAPHSMQVGQTGKTVNPKLYIACGISGAIQHLAGMQSSKVIVAINTDPQAPIFQNCDYGIVGDMFEVVPKMTQELKKLLAE